MRHDIDIKNGLSTFLVKVNKPFHHLCNQLKVLNLRRLSLHTLILPAMAQ